MTDRIADAIKRILELDSGIKRVFSDPPESVSAYPTAIVLEVNGESSRSAFGGLWEATIKARVWILVAPRQHLPHAIRMSRPWVSKVLRLFQERDELAPTDVDEPIGEVIGLEWKEGNLEYAGIQHSGIELTVTARVDQQVVYGC